MTGVVSINEKLANDVYRRLYIQKMLSMRINEASAYQCRHCLKLMKRMAEEETSVAIVEGYCHM